MGHSRHRSGTLGPAEAKAGPSEGRSSPGPWLGQARLERSLLLLGAQGAPLPGGPGCTDAITSGPRACLSSLSRSPFSWLQEVTAHLATCSPGDSRGQRDGSRSPLHGPVPWRTGGSDTGTRRPGCPGRLCGAVAGHLKRGDLPGTEVQASRLRRWKPSGSHGERWRKRRERRERGGHGRPFLRSLLCQNSVHPMKQRPPSLASTQHCANLDGNSGHPTTGAEHANFRCMVVLASTARSLGPGWSQTFAPAGDNGTSEDGRWPEPFTRLQSPPGLAL
ncbi:PREDICTED: uncharacterized protein LOC106148352 [Chinchilla lanigera]|uniref:uncharacterized protein LOC106148352 n=1 Tax=Chinchilla lanigera TaxID=34839 RepID=UPI0006975839|nr:PREDICTED: uncharacterized protein LOC106148352 [Chinchilla lanigera]